MQIGSLWPVDRGFRVFGALTSPSPNIIFFAHAGRRRHTKEKSGRRLPGLLCGGSGLGSAAGLPGVGDKPQRYIFLFRPETSPS